MRLRFTRAVHLLGADGKQVTAGVTRDGDVHLLVAGGAARTRLTPEQASRLAEALRDLARHAREVSR